MVVVVEVVVAVVAVVLGVVVQIQTTIVRLTPASMRPYLAAARPAVSSASPSVIRLIKEPWWLFQGPRSTSPSQCAWHGTPRGNATKIALVLQIMSSTVPPNWLPWLRGVLLVMLLKRQPLDSSA